MKTSCMHRTFARPSPTTACSLLSHICHVPTLLEVTAERSCLRQLMGDPPSMPMLAAACNAAVMAEGQDVPSAECGGR